jgi:phage terminase large subunit
MTPTIQPTKKQHLAWEKLRDQVTRAVVFGGGAGGGKSFLGCEWLLTNCFFYPGTRWFIGRNSLKDIRESTLISWYKVLKHHGIKPDTLFKYNGQDYFFQFHNGSRIDLVDMGYYPSDPFYERFGSAEYTGGWIEEAGEVTNTAAEIISSRVGRMYNDKYKLLGKVLMTCNPTKRNFLYSDYYRPWKQGKLPEGKAFIQSLHGDNPFKDSGYGDVLQQLKGIARQRLLLGDWEYDEDANSLIEYEKIMDCFKNHHINGGVHYITVDIARKGQDTTVIGVWSGRGVKLYQYSKLLTTEITKKVKQFQEKYLVSTSNIMVDEDGVGGGVMDQLMCRGFVNNSRPLPGAVPKYDEKGHQIPENFDNLRSQCYFKLADEINAGRLFIDCDEPDMMQKIIQELEQVKQKDIDSDKKKGVIPKEKIKEVIGRSPDFSDTLSMRMWFELTPQFRILAA